MPSQRQMGAHVLSRLTPGSDTKAAGYVSQCITRRLYGMPLPNYEEASRKESWGCVLALVGSRRRQAEKDHERPKPVLWTLCRPLRGKSSTTGHDEHDN